MLETTFDKFRNENCVSNKLLLKENQSIRDLSFLVTFVTSHPAFVNIEKILNYKITNLHEFVKALTHPSFHNENSEFITGDYERLEFLGDSFIGLAISSILIRDFPESSEGELSKMRASLVNKDSLGHLAKVVGLDQLLLVGRGEVKSNGMEKKSILADIFESVFGAIYSEAGYEKTFEVLENVIEFHSLKTSRSFIDLSRLDSFDYKSRLQEETMHLLGVTPEYREYSKNERNNEESDGQFEIELFIGKKTFGRMISHSKKLAKDQLAQKVFKEKKYKI